MAISPEQKKHGVVLAGSLVAIIGLVWLMQVWFQQPTAALATALPAEQATEGQPQFFRMEGGKTFNGSGTIRIGGEELSIQRVTADGTPLAQGSVLVDNPDTFKVVQRGVEGAIEAHAAGAVIESTDTFFFPKNNASYGDDVDELFYLILWITGVAFVLTEAFFLFCIISFWDRPGRRAFYTQGNHKFELGATLVVVTILVLLALWQNAMWTAMKQVRSQVHTEPFEQQEAAVDRGDLRPVPYQIVGVRFKWYFRHPGLDSKFGTADDIATATMVVPAGREVALTMRSQDVIHSFFLPNYRLKQDVVPGMAIPGWFKPLKPGIFQIMCAELCGEGHTTMGATLEVMEQDKYREWVREKSAENLELNSEEDRPAWFGFEGKFWWWWDANPVRTGYAEDYARAQAR